MVGGRYVRRRSLIVPHSAHTASLLVALGLGRPRASWLISDGQSDILQLAFPSRLVDDFRLHSLLSIQSVQYLLQSHKSLKSYSDTPAGKISATAHKQSRIPTAVPLDPKVLYITVLLHQNNHRSINQRHA
jgi:hypothetical protein